MRPLYFVFLVDADLIDPEMVFALAGPESVGLEVWQHVLEGICEVASHGEGVAVHCDGGKGRRSTPAVGQRCVLWAIF